MSDNFKALMLDKTDDKQTISIVNLDESELMEGNVVVDVTHSTLNYKDGLACLLYTSPSPRDS